MEFITRGIAQIKRLRHGRAGTDGENRLVVFDELLAVLGLHAQFLRAFKIRAAFDDGHVAHLGERGDAVAKLVNDGFLPHAQLVQVERRLAERDAAMRGFAGVDDLMRGVKQRLRGNAAAVETHAAEPLFALDENDFLAEIRRIKRRGITAGTGANNYNFRFDRYP